jgi:peptidoglycan/LPS O-acetylase OafA/YrhL
MSGAKYQWLDLLRGVSALLVCANHLRAAMFVDFSALQNSSVHIKLFYFITGLGAQSVVVFFVLSGFFVGGSVIRRWGDFSYSDYLLSRLTRLWIVLIPALLLTVVVDQITFGLAPGIFTGADFGTLNSGPVGDYSLSLGTLLQNVLFLQTVSAPVFGSNGPLWSLSNEFWYYVCFPLFFIVFDRKKGGRAQVAAIAAIVALGLFVLQDKILGFVVWIVGAGAYCIPRDHRLVRPRRLLAVALPAFMLALVLGKGKVLPGSLDMIFLGLSSLLLIVALRGLPPMPRLLAKITEVSVRASYTLYLVHFPFVLLVYAAFFKGKQVVPDISSCLVFVGLLLALILVAQLFWMLFEKHTDRVKERLFALFHRPETKSVRS